MFINFYYFCLFVPKITNSLTLKAPKFETLTINFEPLLLHQNFKKLNRKISTPLFLRVLLRNMTTRNIENPLVGRIAANVLIHWA